jgi:putative Mg2+ transporter-C (MgtC) family protein
MLDQLFPRVDDVEHIVRVAVRLGLAVVLGGAVGLEREQGGKRAGIRTHMLVSLGAALFTLIGIEVGDATRVMQGVAAGVGFLGAGTILKLSEEHEVKGLTTAAGIWLTAAVGMSVGAGWVWPAVVSVLLALIVLLLFHRLEHWWKARYHHETSQRPPDSV